MSPTFRGGFSTRGNILFNPSPATGTPVFHPGQDTLVYAGDSTDPAYATVTTDTDSWTLRLSTQSVNPTFLGTTTGRGGVGRALQLFYPPSPGPCPPENPACQQQGGTWRMINAPTIPGTVTAFFRMAMKFDGTLDPDQAFALKFCKYDNDYQLVSLGGVPQWDTHNQLPYVNSSLPTFPVFQISCKGYPDEDSPYPNGHDVATQPIGPYLTDMVNSGLYHIFTYEYKPCSVPGATDGVMRQWIDDILVMDLSESGLNVTPPGGNKQYCGIDQLTHCIDASQGGITHYTFGTPQGPFFGSLQTDGYASNMTISYNIGDSNPLNPYTFAWWYR